VKLGKSTARAIHEDSDIPRSKVYETLADLEEKGYIKTMLGTKPVLFTPSSVDAVLGDLEEKAHNSAETARRMLKDLENSRGEEEEEFGWAVTGREKIIMGIRSAIERAEKYIYAASAAPDLLGPVRVPLGAAKQRGVEVILYTTKFGLKEAAELQHYIDVRPIAPDERALTKSMSEVLQAPALLEGDWQPNQLLVMVIDGKESVGVFRSNVEGQDPWALHIRNPLVVLIQWQVVKTVLATVESLVRKRMS
jgi:sugar-specific transcriptional regulator TrmB